MLGYPPTPPPPPGSPAADRPTHRPPRFGSTKPLPPPYSPQNGCTPLGFTHWLAAAPVVRWDECVSAPCLPRVALVRATSAGPGHHRHREYSGEHAVDHGVLVHHHVLLLPQAHAAGGPFPVDRGGRVLGPCCAGPEQEPRRMTMPTGNGHDLTWHLRFVYHLPTLGCPRSIHGLFVCVKTHNNDKTT